jgi:signal transduction histidine kinase
MLGRQQIAGIPTAISELFKNAHDAYAYRVEVDYYRGSRLFVLRDDGIGMTKDQFEGRWLTLGTESKIGKNVVQPRLNSRGTRPIMGEKGIGRLAIGIVGPQVLVLTRSDEIDSLLVASFVNWSAFTLPGINLDQIEIPVKTYEQIPDGSDVRALCEAFSVGLIKAKTDDLAKDFDRILSQVASFDVNPETLLRSFSSPNLLKGDTGTCFFIHPADEQLEASLDERTARAGRGGGAAESGNLEKFLIGFCNTMTHGHPEPVIRAEFRDHRHAETSEELIAPSTFWTPEDVDAADHWIRGRFDEFGQFKGTISIFGEAQPDHVIAWTDARGSRTNCGPFEIEVAVMQGAASESRCTPEKFSELRRKLDRFAGIYVYRNNLRVLPYGNNDYDWLDIEKRRTKSAGYYFFSYRNMFGAILLSREQNAALVEKAGREGFQENKAYRQIKDILANFFVQVAADFFREDAVVSNRADQQRKELRKAFEARKKRDSQTRVQRQQLESELKVFFDGSPVEHAERASANVRAQIGALVASAVARPDDDDATDALIRAETQARHLVDDLREQFKIVKRRGLALKGRLKENFERYEMEFETLEKAVFAPLYSEISTTITSAARQRNVDLDQRKRLELALSEIEKETDIRSKALAKEIAELSSETRLRVGALAALQLSEIQRAAREAESRLASSSLTSLQEEEIVAIRDELESQMESTGQKALTILEDIRVQLTQLQLETDEQGMLITQNDLREALEQRLVSLEERLDEDVELTQMGMAIEVVAHEFEVSVKSVRESLRRLKAWGDVNPKLGAIYRDLSASIQHLDGYLRMFTPMERRLNREKVKIGGTEIYNYLQEVFVRKSQETGVVIKATQGFLGHSFFAFPSTFYPVFINLVDNAIFWTKDVPGEKTVLLDFDRATGQMSVTDSGRGIPERDADRIFDRGFTRKPMGRGLGLYISKQALSEAGYDLSVENVPGARFVITMNSGVSGGV